MATASRFTPGPWSAEPYNWRGEPDPHRFYVSGDAHIADDDGMNSFCTVSTAVAIVEGNATSREVTAANAALIRAAPSLLEALVDLFERAEAYEENAGEFDAGWFKPGLLDKARSAIRAALPQTPNPEDD